MFGGTLLEGLEVLLAAAESLLPEVLGAGVFCEEVFAEGFFVAALAVLARSAALGALGAGEAFGFTGFTGDFADFEDGDCEAGAALLAGDFAGVEAAGEDFFEDMEGAALV